MNRKIITLSLGILLFSACLKEQVYYGTDTSSVVDTHQTIDTLPVYDTTIAIIDSICPDGYWIDTTVPGAQWYTGMLDYAIIPRFPEDSFYFGGLVWALKTYTNPDTLLYVWRERCLMGGEQIVWGYPALSSFPYYRVYNARLFGVVDSALDYYGKTYYMLNILMYRNSEKKQ